MFIYLWICDWQPISFIMHCRFYIDSYHAMICGWHYVLYCTVLLFITSPAGGWWSIVMSASVCLSVREHISRTARAIFTKFLCTLPIAVARSSSGGVTKSEGRRQFWGFVQAIQKHWQSSLHRSLQRRCERNNSVANNVMQQKGSFSMPGKRK